MPFFEHPLPPGRGPPPPHTGSTGWPNTVEWCPMSEAENPQPQAETGTDEEAYPLPPASFEFLVLSMRTQAEIQLGLLHFGDPSDRPKPNLALARHSIDMLSILQEKTKGNLSLEEQRLLENSLTELRFRYVQVAEEGPQR